EVSIKKLWKGDYPSVEEFKSFLKCPIAIEPLINCSEEGFKPVINDKDYDIHYYDFSLIKDPFEDIDPQIFESTSAIENKNVGRNEPCPCQSGKKYKKCCGAHNK
ncbi:SEC-C metal-binding domain-containing protein, partial [Lysinibacillus fusiformis]|uniref:SEC-C metal-binding domain-containing protein n=1 Tax=Lysinibacillus fusiformis TaxID=28031 RepID=UPI001E4B0F42